MAPKCSAEVLAGVPEKTVTCLKEKIHVLDKIGSGMSYRAVGHEFNVNKLTKYTKQGVFKQTDT